jgi:quinol monooxygenase YgiN
MSVTVIVSLEVSDFDQWKTAFDGHAAAREATGINATAYRNLDNEGNAVAIGTASSKEAFITFFTTPEMQEVQKAAGVMAPPEVKFLEEG